eukprot:scaffold676_cov201-Ochromonas_danica.AAC.1
MLRQVAAQQLVDQEKCDLFKILLRYATALMLCPDVENEAVASTGVSSDIVRASMFIFNMMTGFGRIPDHLTEEFAIKEEQEILKNPVRLGKRKVVKVETENGDTIEVKLGSDVCVDLGHGQLARAKVSRLETSERETIVFASPDSSQFAGRHFEFQMTVHEYSMAVAQADSDILGSLTDAHVKEG